MFIFPLVYQKKRVEPVLTHEETQVKKEPEQPIFQPNEVNSQGTTSVEDNDINNVNKDVIAPTVSVQNKTKEKQPVQPAAAQQFRTPPPFLQRFQK